MKRYQIYAAALLSAAFLFSSCADSGTEKPIGTTTADTSVIINTEEIDLGFSNRDENAEYSVSSATSVVFSENSATITGTGTVQSENTVTISQEGTYILSGAASNMQLIVDADKTAKIQIVLSGLSLTNKEGPALYIRTADKVFLTLAQGTENTLSDGDDYTITDEDTTLDAALFSKEDLTINGSGALTVSGNYKHGIVSKDDLVITGGIINITAQKVALNGKDCVKIASADITLSAGTDGIRSDNTEDSTRGYVHISSGTVDITAGNDGIQAETLLSVENGTVKIQSGGGSANASTKSDGSWNNMWGGWGGFGGYNTSTSTNEESAKGLKSTSSILITGGNVTIDSSDDALHANGDIQIVGGRLTLTSGDDGIHADSTLKISGGEINITKSYEGLESAEILIAGGKVTLVASDDGLNAAGGNDSSALGGRPGMGMFENSTGSITISGGYLLVDAAGDGIDSNGALTVTGGITLVSGPTNSGNGPLDYASTADVSGGVLIAVGASGMAQSFTSAENQGAIFTSTGTQNAGKTLALCDENGNIVVSFTPKKAYQCAVITAPNIQKGNTYTLLVGAEITSADENGYAENTSCTSGTKITDIKMTSNVYGSSGGMGGGFSGGGGMGGRPR